MVSSVEYSARPGNCGGFLLFGGHMTISYSKANAHVARILESMAPAQRRQMAQMVPEARDLLYPPPRVVLGPERCLSCPYMLVEHYGTGADQCAECNLRDHAPAD
jgi:hypothetical protein